MKRLFGTCLALVAAGAQASGFYFGDNGAQAMLQGGAFTAQADDLSAMAYNPAGLTQQQGLSFLADVSLLRHDVTFLRQDPGFDPNNPSTTVNTVNSQKDPYLLPFFGLGYGFDLGNRPFTVALGLFAPPSQGRYTFPGPGADNYGGGDARRLAPQRYALINTDILIAYPTLSLAYAIHPRFQVGVSLQLTVSHFSQTQMLYGGDVFCPSTGTCSGQYNPQKQLQEKPDYDALVTIDLPGQVGFTGILGVMGRPTDWLSFGASVRPPIPFKATGKMTVALSEFFKQAGASVDGDTATLQMTMPLEVRAGARVVALNRPNSDWLQHLGINLDFVYQGWNSVDKLLLTPDNVSINVNGGSTAVAPFAVQKNWHPTWSVRLGASLRLMKYLSVSAGALYETGSSDTAYFSVDWAHPSRFIFTGGLTGHLGPVDVIAGFMGTPTTTVTVTDGALTRGQTNPAITPGVVNDGIYTSGGYGLIFGVRGHFESLKPAAKPLEPTTAPEPAKPVPVEPPPPETPAETTAPTPSQA